MARKPAAPTVAITCRSLLPRLAAGESAQDLLAEFVDAVCSEKTTPNIYGLYTRPRLLDPLELLTQRGARLASGEPGCAFEKLMKLIHHHESLMSSCLLDDLISTPGDIPLHIMAREAPSCLQVHLSGVPRAEVLASLRQRDAQGRTPSHWLWSPDGVLVQQANRARTAASGPEAAENELAKKWFATMQAAWKTQALLEDQGVRLDIPDNDGITAMDLCLARINAEDAILLPGQEICRKVRAYMAAKDLCADTPEAMISPHAASPRF